MRLILAAVLFSVTPAASIFSADAQVAPLLRNILKDQAKDAGRTTRRAATASRTATTAAAGAVARNYTHRVTANSLNMRSCASTNCRIVDRLNMGDGVTVLHDNGRGWVRVQAYGTQAVHWVSREFLEEVAEDATIETLERYNTRPDAED